MTQDTATMHTATGRPAATVRPREARRHQPTPEASPAGDQRERSVRCTRCGMLTWNYSAVCDPCHPTR